MSAHNIDCIRAYATGATHLPLKKECCDVITIQHPEHIKDQDTFIWGIRLSSSVKSFHRFLQITPTKKYEDLYFNLFAFKFFKNSENRNILLFGISRLANPLIVIPYILGFEFINFGRKRYFVRLKTHVVGTFALGEKSEALYIGTLTVNPQYRNLGVATYILTYAERLAMRTNKKWLELSVHKVNNPAIRLFKKFGFVKKEDKKRFITLRKNVETH